jgi:GH43 family beta-xylosidase
MIGAHILREHYRLSANAVSGAAFYCLSPELNPVAFAEYKNGQIGAGLNSFHSWIECKEYVIDFLAPLFPENIAELDEQAEVPRHAFMKPLSSMADRLPTKGEPVGTFFLIPDEVCQANMIRTFY